MGNTVSSEENEVTPDSEILPTKPLQSTTSTMTVDPVSRPPSRRLMDSLVGAVPSRIGQPDISPGDVVIAIMGITGSGKTTFVNHFADTKLDVGHGLEPCTRDVQVASCKVDGERIWLVDTPGFDDTYRTDAEILREVSNWLNTAYKKQVKLTGIIYLHRIMDVRVGGAGVKNLRMFKRLCGDDGLGSVVLATTMWSLTDEATGKTREQQLQTHEVFWKHMIEQGSRVFRQDRGRESGLELLRHLITKRRPVVLDIQKEMVDQNKKLGQTGAGSEVATEVDKAKRVYEKKLQEIRQELEEALREKDHERQEELREYKRDFERKLANGQEELRKMHADSEQLHREMREQHEKEMRELADMIKEKDRLIQEAQNEAIMLRQSNEKDLELEKLKMQLRLKEQYYKMIYQATHCIVM